MTHRLGRRDFARLLAGAGVGASVATLPFVRRGLAAPPGVARATRLLIINFPGGIRSSAAFLASTQQTFNPWGLLSTNATVPFSLGRLLDDHIEAGPGGLAETPREDSHYALSFLPGVRLPRLREVAHTALTVAGTYNEARGDHLASQTEETTGERSAGSPGILTRIHQGLVAQSGGSLAIPPFHLRPMALGFGRAPGDAVVYAPVTLDGTDSLPSQNVLPQELVALTGSQFDPTSGSFALDRRATRDFGSANLTLANSFATMQMQAIELSEQLTLPYLNTGNDSEEFLNAAAGSIIEGEQEVSLTNARLLEILGKSTHLDPGEEQLRWERQADIANVALALRCLQLGSPAVTVEVGDFDWHSNEVAEAPPIYHMVGQLWASLHWLLARIPEPTDETGQLRMLDRTLVVTMSDFGRDAGSSAGFNAGEGSDHGQDPSCLYLAHAVMGAGIQPGRLVGGVDTSTYDARQEDERYGTQDLLATTLYALGLDPQDEGWGYPEANPITRLWESA